MPQTEIGFVSLDHDWSPAEVAAVDSADRQLAAEHFGIRRNPAEVAAEAAAFVISDAAAAAAAQAGQGSAHAIPACF